MSASCGGFTRLPLPDELLREVFKHIERKIHLAQLCLVSKTWNSYAVPWLYECIFVYTWHKAAKQKVWMILETLAASPQVAVYVKSLEFRDFPTHLGFDERRRLVTLSVQAFSNCVNLQSCSLTRDGTLSTQILKQLADLKHLKELEINGQPGAWGAWVPEDLRAFRQLQKLTLIMPSRSVAEALPVWVLENTDTLESLDVICKFTTYINDNLLQEMKPALKKLRRLHLAGCIKVTEASISSIVAENDEIRSLALESCSPSFDMGAFAIDCAERGRLLSLTSISLTIPLYKESAQRQLWLNRVLLLLENSPLESFQLYAGGGAEDETSYVGVNDQDIKKLVDSHTSTLRRIAIQRLIVPLESLGYACEKCPGLEDIFATLCNVNRDALAHALAGGKCLRNLHLTLMTDVTGRPRPLHLVTAQEVCLHVAQNCGESLRLIGSQTRVWQVQRRFSGEHATISLGPYTGHRIPEQFLMMRS